MHTTFSTCPTPAFLPSPLPLYPPGEGIPAHRHAVSSGHVVAGVSGGRGAGSRHVLAVVVAHGGVVVAHGGVVVAHGGVVVAHGGVIMTHSSVIVAGVVCKHGTVVTVSPAGHITHSPTQRSAAACRDGRAAV